MQPRLRPPVIVVACALAVAVGVSGCVGPLAATTTPFVGPSASCNGADPYAQGYYPALEARLPRSWDGRQPTAHNSGRYCSSAGLGHLESLGIHELRYAGATWTASDNQSSLSMIVYEASGLTAAKLADGFEQGARAAQGVQGVSRQTVQVHGRPGVRLDVLTGSSREARIIWPAADGGAVDVINASDVTEQALASAEEAFAT